MKSFFLYYSHLLEGVFGDAGVLQNDEDDGKERR
jgi:hypothetical protein